MGKNKLKNKKKMKKIISLLALMSMLFTANNVDAKNDKTSETITTNKVTILKKVFKKNKHTYKEAYKYDKEGNMVNIITFIKENGFWKPVSAYSIHYGENENVVTYALWDDQHKTFTMNAKQDIYSNKEFATVIDSLASR